MKRVAILLALLAAACPRTVEDQKAAAPAQPHATIRMKGSDAMKPLATKLAAAYRNAHVVVDGGGSAAGFAALADGSADIAEASSRITPEAQAAVAKRGAVVETPVGYDVVAIYTSPSNPVQQLSLSQLAGIFGGTITNWSAVGGPNAAIVVYGQPSEAGFTSWIATQPITPKPQRDFADARGVIAAVAADPAGIGYAAYIPTTQARVVWIQRTEGGVATAPSRKTIADQTYPLSGRLYFYTLASAPRDVKDFVQFVRSPRARTVFEEAGAVQE